MAYITINFDKLSRDDWDNWCEAWGECIDCEEDVPCPEGEWDVFFREGSMPADRADRKFWDWLVCKYFDFLVDQEEERRSNYVPLDIYEGWSDHVPAEHRYDPRYA